jgi:hypothetical protein
VAAGRVEHVVDGGGIARPGAEVVREAAAGSLVGPLGV